MRMCNVFKLPSFTTCELHFIVYKQRRKQTCLQHVQPSAQSDQSLRIRLLLTPGPSTEVGLMAHITLNQPTG